MEKAEEALEQCLCDMPLQQRIQRHCQRWMINQCVLTQPITLLINKIENPITVANQPLRSTNDRGFNGSAHFTGCQQKTWKSWKDWVGEIKRSHEKVDGTKHFAPYWHYKVNEFIKDKDKLAKDDQYDNAPLYNNDVMFGKNSQKE